MLMCQAQGQDMGHPTSQEEMNEEQPLKKKKKQLALNLHLTSAETVQLFEYS